MLSRHSLCSPHFGPITNGTAAHLIILSIQQHHIWIFRIIRIIKFIHVINFIKIKIKLITSGGRPQLALLLFVISLLLLLMNQGGGLLRWAGVHNWLFCYMLFGIALLLFVICYSCYCFVVIVNEPRGWASEVGRRPQLALLLFVICYCCGYCFVVIVNEPRRWASEVGGRPQLALPLFHFKGLRPNADSAARSSIKGEQKTIISLFLSIEIKY